MECKGIKEKLCAYLEGIVSPEEKRIIEEHLPSCPECRKNLADLKKAGELVKNLAEVEPPPWFTQKIMSRIRAEEEEKKGLWQKLFYPLHIKVPIQALATVFIAVIAVYVFKAVEPEMKLDHLPSPTQPPTQQVMPKEERKEASQPPQVIRLDSSTRKESPLKDEAARESVRAPAVPPSAALPAPAAEPLRAERKQEAEESLGKSEGVALSKAAPEMQDRKLAAAPRFRETAALKLKPANVLIKVPDVHVAGSKVEDLFRQLGARKIERESREGREILTAELDAQQLNEFLEKLKALGEVSDKDLSWDSTARDVVVRVEVVSVP
jgi:hypothetical protein